MAQTDLPLPPASPAAIHPSGDIAATMLEFYRRMLEGEADAANELISWKQGLPG
jgi:hypothetical protein